MIGLTILLIFMIVGAIIAVEIKDLLSSVIAVGAVGLGLSIVFLILQAPDVAITQLVVEILCLIILIRATLKRDIPFSTSGRWFFNTLITGSFITAFLLIAVRCFREMPMFGDPIMKVGNAYLEYGLAKTGAPNIVSSVILDFRAFDTLGEATILFTAVIGVLTIVRQVGRKKDSLQAGKEK
ncbi:MAG: hydrogen gas-evolving membrane-bound hydrogenase subunit E [Candidatus Omnitrophota bacterium]